MFMERMALEATLRREKLTSEARVYQGLRPYRRAPRWKALLFTRLGEGLAAWGAALQRQYRQAETKPVLPAISRPEAMEQTR